MKKCSECQELKPLGSFSKNKTQKDGLVRGLLCGSCNNGIGRFKDRIDRLSNAITYLESFETKERTA